MRDPEVLEVDLDSPVPASEQIRAQVTDRVRSGVLAAGTRLPTVRALAAELGIAPGTVARAYKDLTADGIVQTAGRRGTVVASVPPAASAGEVEAELLRAVAVARTAGWDAARVRAVVEHGLT